MDGYWPGLPLPKTEQVDNAYKYFFEGLAQGMQKNTIQQEMMNGPSTLLRDTNLAAINCNERVLGIFPHLSDALYLTLCLCPELQNLALPQLLSTCLTSAGIH